MKLIIDIPDKVKTYLDQTTTYDREDYYVQHFSLLIADAIKNGTPYEETPQDEWIDHSEDGYVECPFCGHLTTCDDNIDELHYCWNCGAKLGKGGAE